MSTAQEKLEALATKHPSDAKMIANKLDSLKTAEVLLSLKDHDGMKMLIKGAERNIIAIDAILTTDRKLNELDRKVAFAQRDVFEWFLGQFTGADITEKSINDYAKTYGK